MSKVPFCVANNCVIPRHTGKECEIKKCPHIIYMDEADAMAREHTINAY